MHVITYYNTMKYCTLLVKINNNYLKKTYIFLVFRCMVRTKLQKQANEICIFCPGNSFGDRNEFWSFLESSLFLL